MTTLRDAGGNTPLLYDFATLQSRNLYFYYPMSLNFARISTLQPITRLINHLQAPLFRNGYALVFNSAVTAVLGLLYWMVAANYYDAETVGINSALISTMMFLANVTQLNLTNGLNRFLPTAGQATAHFILIVYVLCWVVTPLACLVYFLVLRISFSFSS